MSNEFLGRVLKAGEFPLAAQRVFADDPALLPYLADNQFLDEGLVAELLSRRPRLSAAVTASLLSRRLSSDTQLFVVSSETRVEPLLDFLDANEDCLASGVVDKLLSKVSNLSVLSRLSQIPSLTPVQRRAVVTQAGGLCLLEFLLVDAYDACAVSLPDLVGFLSTVESWRTRGLHSRYRLRLSALLHVRPEVVAPLVACFDPGRVPDTLLTPLAGCRFLTDLSSQRVVAGLSPDGLFVGDLGVLRYGLVSLVYNPVCSAEVLEELRGVRASPYEARTDFLRAPLEFRSRTRFPRPTVSVGYESVDESVLGWLVSRAVSGSARLWDMPALLENPLLTEPQAQNLLNKVLSSYYGADEVFPDARRQELADRFVVRFPDLNSQVVAARVQWEYYADVRRAARSSSEDTPDVLKRLHTLRRDPELRACVSAMSVPFQPDELSPQFRPANRLDTLTQTQLRTAEWLTGSMGFAASLAAFADLLVEAADVSAAAWSFVASQSESWPGSVRELCEFAAMVAQPDSV